MPSRGNPAKKARAAPGGKDTYFELVRRHPLRPLRSETELAAAVDLVDELLDRESLDLGEEDYLEVLGDLVRKYEAEHHPMPPVSDREMLRHLIDSRGLTQSLVADATGIAESTVSAVLSGKRKLNRKHIEALASYFAVGPSVFLGA